MSGIFSNKIAGLCAVALTVFGATTVQAADLVLGITAPQAMPEPVTATLTVMGLGALSMATYRRRNK